MFMGVTRVCGCHTCLLVSHVFVGVLRDMVNCDKNERRDCTVRTLIQRSTNPISILHNVTIWRNIISKLKKHSLRYDLTHNLEPGLQLFGIVCDISVVHNTAVLSLVRCLLSVRERQLACNLTVLVRSEEDGKMSKVDDFLCVTFVGIVT